MPLAQVDSAGGVIVGEWYQNPNVPNERVKVTVAILDGALRAEAMHQLYRMNITQATLFPDLEGLARSIAYELEETWPIATRES